jgi:peptide chain release factor 1
MFPELEAVEEKYRQLTLALSDPALIGAPQKIKEISKERAELEPLVRKFGEYKKVQKDIRDSQDILDEPGSEPELRSMADGELKRLQAREAALEQEIRAGAGGDESSLFAQDLFRMYSRYAEQKGWKIEVLDTSVSPIGGFKEAIAGIQGKKVYSLMKYESGVHRVQRVPKTEGSGRIHTSTVTVAVLPEADEIDVKLDPKDLKIEAFGSSGPGGQSVNRNYTAIRVTHKPSGMVVSCQDEKSQHRNKEKALRVLRSRLMEIARSERQAKIALDRRTQVGTGERSEKIRTYNFPQSRVTDHRLNESFHNLAAVLDGDLDKIVDKLVLQNQARLLDKKEAS